MDEGQMIELLRGGSEQGLREVIAVYGIPVQKICSVVLRGYDEQHRQDAEQTAFIRLWKSRERLTAETDLKGYIYAIARNAAIDIIRRERGRVAEDIDLAKEVADDTDIPDQLEQNERRRLLQSALDQLPEPEGQIFFCRYFLNMRMKEIAAALDVSEKKVENTLSRGRGRLRRILDERGIHGYDEI